MNDKEINDIIKYLKIAKMSYSNVSKWEDVAEIDYLIKTLELKKVGGF